MAGDTNLKVSGGISQPIIPSYYPVAQAPESTVSGEKGNSQREVARDSVSISPEASLLNKNATKLDSKPSEVTAKADGNNAITDLAKANEYAKSIISDRLTEMKTTLEGITKNFPPFPVESMQRAEILQSYSALRKEIERMTVPPPLDALNNKLGWMWDDLFNEKVLKNLPEPLALDAPDSEVHAAVGKITSIQDSVNSSELTQP